MKRLASRARPLLSRPMKRLAFPVLAAAAAFGFGACEKHSSAELPEHYQHKWDAKHAETEHAAPAHAEQEKAPAADHKG